MRGGGKFPPDTREISSSTSHPGLGAQTLATSDAQPGEELLEISTGYHTALLAHRLGAHHVLGVEVAARPAGAPDLGDDHDTW